MGRSGDSNSRRTGCEAATLSITLNRRMTIMSDFKDKGGERVIVGDTKGRERMVFVVCLSNRGEGPKVQ